MTTRDVFAVILVLSLPLAFYINHQRQKSELRAVKQQLWHDQAKSDLAAHLSLMCERFRSAGSTLNIAGDTLYEKNDDGGKIVYSLDYTYTHSEVSPPNVDRIVYWLGEDLRQFRGEYRWEIKSKSRKTSGEGYGAFDFHATYSLLDLN